MAENFPFIGRQKEIDTIEKILFDWGTTQLIGIHSDDGGIGKTRLIQELFTKYTNSEYNERRLLVVPIIDFDDRSVSSRGTLQRKIVFELGDKNFTSYLRRMVDWRKVEAAGVSPQRLEEESTIVRKEFQNCLNQISLSKRIVFLLDTTERVETNEIWDFLGSMLVESQNIVVIMAGRNVNKIYHEFFPTTGKFRKSLIHLTPFESKDRDYYLEVKLASIKQAFHDETINKIKSLSGGIPILLDLAVERLAQDDQFARFLASKPLSFFENLSSENRSESENIMVSYLVDQRSDLAQLVLLLAHVYPVNKNMLQDMLHLDSSKVDILLQKALGTVYIKNLLGGRISLHDEMRRMVNEYTWPICDPDTNLRKQYSQTTVEFFEKDISYLDQQIAELYKIPDSLERSIELDNFTRRKDNAQTEYLRHLLIVDINKGIEYYLKTAEDARKSYRLRFAQKMGTYVAKIEHMFSGEYKYQVELMRIKLLMDSDSRNAMQAKVALQLLLDEAVAASDENKRVQIINSIGRCEVLMGNYKDALTYEEEVLSSLTRPDDIVVVLNYVGYICRLMGDWRKATSYYKKALNVAQTSSSVSENTIAGIYNNLAYVICLLGNYVEAKAYCLEAIRIWEKKGTTSLVGRGYLTRAIIYRDRGKYDDATPYFKKAIEVFEKLDEPDDYRYLAGAYFDYAWSLWFEGDSSTYDNREKTIDLYENSKKYFDRAKETAEKYDVISVLPGILNQMSNVYWRLGMKEDARLFLDQAYELSKKYNDVRYQIDSLLGFAEFDSDEEVYDKIDAYAVELKEKYEDQGYEFPLFYGRMKRIRAESALTKKDFVNARELFAEGLAQISQHGGYGVYFLDRELARLKSMMTKNLEPDRIIEWATFFQNYWLVNASQKEEKIGTFVSWCSTFISQTKFD